MGERSSCGIFVPEMVQDLYTCSPADDFTFPFEKICVSRIVFDPDANEVDPNYPLDEPLLDGYRNASKGELEKFISDNPNLCEDDYKLCTQDDVKGPIASNSVILCKHQSYDESSAAEVATFAALMLSLPTVVGIGVIMAWNYDRQEAREQAKAGRALEQRENQRTPPPSQTTDKTNGNKPNGRNGTNGKNGGEDGDGKGKGPVSGPPSEGSPKTEPPFDEIHPRILEFDVRKFYLPDYYSTDDFAKDCRPPMLCGWPVENDPLQSFSRFNDWLSRQPIKDIPYLLKKLDWEESLRSPKILFEDVLRRGPMGLGDSGYERILGLGRSNFDGQASESYRLMSRRDVDLEKAAAVFGFSLLGLILMISGSANQLRPSYSNGILLFDQYQGSDSPIAPEI